MSSACDSGKGNTQELLCLLLDMKQCHGMPNHAVQCHTMLRYAVLGKARPHMTTPRQKKPRCMALPFTRHANRFKIKQATRQATRHAGRPAGRQAGGRAGGRQAGSQSGGLKNDTGKQAGVQARRRAGRQCEGLAGELHLGQAQNMFTHSFRI